MFLTGKYEKPALQWPILQKEHSRLGRNRIPKEKKGTWNKRPTPQLEWTELYHPTIHSSFYQLSILMSTNAISFLNLNSHLHQREAPRASIFPHVRHKFDDLQECVACSFNETSLHHQNANSRYPLLWNHNSLC